MALCRKMVEGGAVAFPCSLGLPDGHAGPCAAVEKPASLAKRDQWVKENHPSDAGYIEPRRSVEFVVEPGSISKVPGQPEPEPEPAPPVLATDLGGDFVEVEIPKRPRPTQGEVDRVIDYLLHAHAGWENWYELVRLREQLDEIVGQMWRGQYDVARIALEAIVARLPHDGSE